MKESTERKIRVIYAGWSNGNNKDTAKLIRSLSKQELFYLVSSHVVLAIPELLGSKERQISLENFICNSLEGFYD